MTRLGILVRSLCWLACCGTCVPLYAFDVRRLTIEELMELNVYSAARRDESARASSAAVYVPTGEDIRRARVTSVPEALRLVPGVQVARAPHARLAHGVGCRSDIELDATLRYVDALPTVPATTAPVPAYVTLDLGLGWRLARGLDMSLVGQNLLDSHHPEQPTGPISSTTEVQRGVYARLNW